MLFLNVHIYACTCVYSVYMEVRRLVRLSLSFAMWVVEISLSLPGSVLAPRDNFQYVTPYYTLSCMSAGK